MRMTDIDVEMDDPETVVDLTEINKYLRSHAFAKVSHSLGGVPKEMLKAASTSDDFDHWRETRTAGHVDAQDAFRIDVGAVTMGDVRLRALQGSDLGPLYEMSSQPSSSFRWRFRGQIVSFDHFVQTLEENVLVQMVAEDRRTGQPLSLNVLYGYDHFNQTCTFGYIGFAGTEDLSFERTLGVALTFSYGFSRWPLRTIYAEIPGYNTNVLEGLPGDFVREEGRLRDFFFYDGAWWDKVIIAISRGDWTTYIDQFR